jgi:hypothetical protein
MRIRNPRRAVLLQIGLAALFLAGCRPAQQSKSADERSNPDAAGLADDTRRVVEAALGKQAEVLAHGDLARNGLEQLLIVNRFDNAPRSSAGLENPAAIFITRAAILEKSNGQWTEVLRCDEHLKNPNGYLGGSSAARVNGWRLEFSPDTTRGLEMKFTPAYSEAGEQESGTGEPAGQTVVVRWNTKAKRYQSLDASHERYLSEAPTLETPHSILR